MKHQNIHKWETEKLLEYGKIKYHFKARDLEILNR